MSAYHCIQLSYTTHAELKSSVIFPVILQTIIIAQTMSSGREGKQAVGSPVHVAIITTPKDPMRV